MGAFWDIKALYKGRHFADDIFKRISFISEFNLIIQWSILAIIQHQIRWWLGAKQATSHYLKQWSPLICGWINNWLNNNEAGDLRRHRVHYDVIIMRWVNGYQLWDSWRCKQQTTLCLWWRFYWKVDDSSSSADFLNRVILQICHAGYLLSSRNLICGALYVWWNQP